MFTDQEKEGLQLLLSHAVRPEQALDIDQLAGYLFGIVITPEVSRPSEWFADIFGEALAAFNDSGEADVRFGALVQAYNRLNALRLAGRLHFPFDLTAADARLSERMRAWAEGLDRALALRSWVWMPEEILAQPDMDEEHEEIMTCLMVVLGVAHPEKIPEIFEGIEELDGGKKEAWTALLGQLPLAVEALVAHGRELESERLAGFQGEETLRQDWVLGTGRNDPCPCGSGRKYKKCCGLN